MIRGLLPAEPDAAGNAGGLDRMTLRVNELFYSIQGESSLAGYPCVFGRLGGCNLRCAYCDTAYAYEEGSAETRAGVLARVASYGCRMVEITGGEPLMQAETPLLIADLLAQGYTVLLETNGSLDISSIDQRCIRIVDLKCPSSGEAQKTDFGNIARLTPRDEIKFVAGDRGDYEYARGLIRQHGLAGRVRHIHISPVWARLQPAELAAWILADRLEARISLQLHKLLWPQAVRGV